MPSVARVNSRRRTVLVAFVLALVPMLAQAQATATHDCIMEPAQIVQLGSPVVGIIDQVLVDRGDVVKKGQPIVRLRSAVDVAAVAVLKARAGSNARIAAQQARLKLATNRLERARSLRDKGVISTDRFEELESELEFALQELERERVEQELARLEMQRAQTALAQRTVRSPIDGIVMERLMSPGELVQQENHVVRLAALAMLHVEVFLPVALFPRVEIGMVARVKPNPPVTGEYEAVVSVIDRVFDAASGSFGMRLILLNDDLALPGGHRCTVTFDLRS